MAHEVRIDASISQVLHKDIELTVKTDGAKLGTLKVSKGGVEWVPRGKSVNTIHMSWDAFARRMESEEAQR